MIQLHRMAAAAALLLAAATHPASAAEDDWSHDFDFDLGTWKTHSTRLMHPLAHSAASSASDWADLDGVTVVKPIWGGKANLAELKSDGPGGHVELLSLRWYNAKTRQWSLDFATSKGGVLGTPGVGEFKNGRADFYDQEDFNGRAIFVRFSIWPVDKDTSRSEQAFSDDGGKTWEVNWKTTYTRVPDQPSPT